MSGYTVKNLKDVEDAAANTSEVEARFARKHLDSRELGVSYFRYGPGFRSGMGHSHRQQEEVYIVTSGSGQVKLGDEILELKQWDVLRVAPEVIRAFQGGAEGLEFVVVGSSRPEEGDGVPVKDWWTD
ncbi:MAG TPA: hypothetical protein VID48_02695 [Solirubrobacteraceae bacterium]|jgi:mannose-6-phosphate isomerase-like protein (cupin superfamily)